MQHRPVVRTRRASGAYAELSARPLYVLVFLLPLILLYEIGWSVYMSDPALGAVETIRAHSILLAFFQDFGVAGRFLPALSLIAVLLTWHFFREDPWRIKPLVLPGMAVESFAWTIPLVVLIALLQLLGAPVPAAAQLRADAGLATLPWQSRAAISIGAGLYEEFLFRMIGMAALHLVLVDLARMSERAGAALAILISAAAFSVYHDVSPGGELDALKAVSLLFAGAYFGLVYTLRGFGVVVAVHALYDLFALVVLPRS